MGRTSSFIEIAISVIMAMKLSILQQGRWLDVASLTVQSPKLAQHKATTIQLQAGGSNWAVTDDTHSQTQTHCPPVRL